MKEHRLLKRISEWERGLLRTNRTSTDALVLSVKEHLSRLLNTRQGNAQFDPHFGVPDISNMSGDMSGRYTNELAAAIQRAVLVYEPRVRHARVSALRERSEALLLSFCLEGTLAGDEGPTALRLLLSINWDGRVSLT
jgi:type VI secretion system protein